jgi:hypothetical protein
VTVYPHKWQKIAAAAASLNFTEISWSTIAGLFTRDSSTIVDERFAIVLLVTCLPSSQASRQSAAEPHTADNSAAAISYEN